MYLPHRQFRFWYGGGPARGMTLVVRTGAVAAAAPAIRGVFADHDPAVGLGPFLTLEEAYRDILARPRLLASLLAAFAAITLLLAAVGVYGVMAHSVGRRRREFGIRAALGAGAGSIARDVVAEGLALAGLGIAGGLVGALILSRSLRSVLFGVSATDPWVLAGGALVLLATALAASWIPARRALSIDPSEALKLE
jgi:ABC-type antimicrobial peptide transport system permease subunit